VQQPMRAARAFRGKMEGDDERAPHAAPVEGARDGHSG
jgi:hypothetical protein